MKIKIIFFALTVLLCLSPNTPMFSPPDRSAGEFQGELDVITDISDSNVKKDSMDHFDKKLSSQLLQLTDSEYLLPDISRNN